MGKGQKEVSWVRSSLQKRRIQYSLGGRKSDSGILLANPISGIFLKQVCRKPNHGHKLCALHMCRRSHATNTPIICQAGISHQKKTHNKTLICFMRKELCHFSYP